MPELRDLMLVKSRKFTWRINVESTNLADGIIIVEYI